MSFIPILVGLVSSLLIGAVAAAFRRKPPRPRLPHAPESPVIEDGSSYIPVPVGTCLLTGLSVTRGSFNYYRSVLPEQPNRLGGDLDIALTYSPFTLRGLETAMPSGAARKLIRYIVGDPARDYSSMQRAGLNNNLPRESIPWAGVGTPNPFNDYWADYNWRPSIDYSNGTTGNPPAPTLFVKVELWAGHVGLHDAGNGLVPVNDGSGIARLWFRESSHNWFEVATDPKIADWGTNFPPLAAWIFKDPRSTAIRQDGVNQVQVSDWISREITWREDGPSPTTRGFSWDDINPADIIIGILTNKEWGLGLDAGRLDTASFDDARTVLRSEGMGMSFIIDGGTPIVDILSRICDVIEGGLITTANGRTGLELIRPQFVNPHSVVYISPSNYATCMEQRPAPVSAVARGEFFDPLARGPRVVEREVFSGLSVSPEGDVLEVDLFGITYQPLAEDLVLRRLVRSTLQPSAFSVDVAMDVAEGLTFGQVVILQRPSQKDVACHVMSVDYPAPDGAFASVILRESTDSSYTAPPPEELDPVVVPQPLPIPLTRERAPYFQWAKSYTGTWDLTTIIGQQGDNHSWAARAISYAKRPVLGNQDGWALGEKLATSTAAPAIWNGARWLVTVDVTGTANRAVDTVIGETSLFVSDTDILQVGDILRVDVDYPSLPFPDSREFTLDYEYVQVIEITGAQSIKVARGLFDTSVAPSVVAGEALVVGHLPLIEQVSGPWYNPDLAAWSDYGTLGTTQFYPSDSTTVGPILDQRGLGVKSGVTLPWDEGTPQAFGLLSLTGEDLDSNTRYAARAVRPYDAGAAFIDEDGGDIIIRFEGRSRAMVERIIPRNVPGSDAVGGNMGSEAGRVYELWVFGDGAQVGYLDWTDISNSSFTITPTMINSWGGPFTDLEFALCGVWRSGANDIPSWQYTYLKYEGTTPGGLYDETAHGFGRGEVEVTESYMPPGAIYETATPRGRGRVIANEQIIIAPYLEGASGTAKASGNVSEQRINASTLIGHRSTSATVGAGKYTPNFTSVGAQNGQEAVLAIMSSSFLDITGVGWTVTRRVPTSGGSLQIFARTVAPGFNNGNTALNIPNNANLSLVLMVIDGVSASSNFGIAQPDSSATIPVTGTNADGARVFSIGFAGWAGPSQSHIGNMAINGWTARSSANTGITQLNSATFSNTTLPNGTAIGTGISPANPTGSDTIAGVHLTFYEVT